MQLNFLTKTEDGVPTLRTSVETSMMPPSGSSSASTSMMLPITFSTALLVGAITSTLFPSLIRVMIAAARTILVFPVPGAPQM